MEEAPEYKEFTPDSTEYKQVYDLMLRWTEENNITYISNCTEGEILTVKFERYVKDNHRDVYEAVKEDDGIYGYVLVEWNERDL